MTKQTLFSLAVLLLISSLSTAQKYFEIKSPDSMLLVRVAVGQSIVYSVSHAGELILEESPVSMIVGDGSVLGKNASIRKANIKAVDEQIEAPFYKRAKVRMRYVFN